jgi:hypothetical protein
VIALIRKRKSRSRKYRTSVSKPASRYRNPIATVPSSTDSASQSIQERLNRIENNYEQLDRIWADIENRLTPEFDITSPKKPR